MEALKQKWNSSRGASIMVALLFMLVCMMVGASILMAAASSVGKYESNKKEQQKYLTVSSALSMLVDELEKVEYVGRYTYSESHVSEVPPVGEPDDPGYTPGTPAYDVYTYTQGSVTANSAWLDTVLPMSKNFDYIFAETIRDKYTGCECSGPSSLSNSTHTVHNFYIYDSNSFSPKPSNTYTLTFAVNNYDALSGTVTIEAELRTDGSIHLKAALEGGEYSMEALLRPKPDEWPEKRLVLRGDEEETYTIGWKLEYIFKKELE